MLLAEKWTHGLFGSVFILFHLLFDLFNRCSRWSCISFGHFFFDCLFLDGLFFTFGGRSGGLGGLRLLLCGSLGLALGLRDWLLFSLHDAYV